MSGEVITTADDKKEQDVQRKKGFFAAFMAGLLWGASSPVSYTHLIGETDIVENGEYLFANYVDPAMYAGMVILMVIIVLAGILTIYSIYLSLIHI